jgi:hypothetical protein
MRWSQTNLPGPLAEPVGPSPNLNRITLDQEGLSPRRAAPLGTLRRSQSRRAGTQATPAIDPATRTAGGQAMIVMVPRVGFGFGNKICRRSRRRARAGRDPSTAVSEEHPLIGQFYLLVANC